MRPSWDRHFMEIAKVVSTMGTCARRQVGCVLVDSRRRILSTGFNGVAPGREHCRDNPNSECPAIFAKSGTDLDGCDANHAELNAVLHCSDVMAIDACYVTTSPCTSCVKVLLHTGCRRIVFDQLYPQPRAAELWTKTVREQRIRTWEEVARD